MKSMLHEASTVIKAIEKAWVDSGKPLKFAVNVLELEEKNFLGLSKKPAIISLSYDPKEQIVKARKPEKKSKPLTKTRDKSQRTKEAPIKQESEQDEWTRQWINDIKIWLQEMMSLLNSRVPFDLKSDKKTLKITFNQNLLPSSEVERQLFIGLSYMLIQFLKKKYKKKLRGYHLVLSIKKHAENKKLK